jgi:asparagine synthase (glutamine-hydrolysing)
VLSEGVHGYAALRPVEVAYGLAIGRHPGVRTLPRRGDATPAGALEQVLRHALRRPPCLVSFSGGRDSSLLLAAATAVARRERLPEPVPATLLFPGSGETEEGRWQKLVLSKLGLDDWVRLEFGDELDAVGPVAQRLLRRHGLVWPFNLHFHLPIVEAAEGGSVVTGFGGDELGESCNVVRAERMIVRRRVGRPRDLAAIAYRLGPRAPRWPREYLRAGGQIDDMGISWLTPRGQRRLRSAFASDSLLVAGWDRIVRNNFWRSRFFQVCKANFQLMADPHQVEMVHPFVEPPVLQALARSGGFAGPRDRRQILELLGAGALLPPDLLRREHKALFDAPLWTGTARAFARDWSGRGLDEDLIDPEAARRAWLRDPAPPLATTMLQAAWLADNI